MSDQVKVVPQVGDFWEKNLFPHELLKILHVGQDKAMIFTEKEDEECVRIKTLVEKLELKMRNGRKVRRFDPEKADWPASFDYFYVDEDGKGEFGKESSCEIRSTSESRGHIYLYDVGKTFDRPKPKEKPECGQSWCNGEMQTRCYTCTKRETTPSGLKDRLKPELVIGRRYWHTHLENWLLLTEKKASLYCFRDKSGRTFLWRIETIKKTFDLSRDWWAEKAVGKWFINPDYSRAIIQVGGLPPRGSELGRNIESGEIACYGAREVAEADLLCIRWDLKCAGKWVIDNGEVKSLDDVDDHGDICSNYQQELIDGKHALYDSEEEAEKALKMEKCAKSHHHQCICEMVKRQPARGSRSIDETKEQAAQKAMERVGLVPSPKDQIVDANKKVWPEGRFYVFRGSDNDTLVQEVLKKESYLKGNFPDEKEFVRFCESWRPGFAAWTPIFGGKVYGLFESLQIASDYREMLNKQISEECGWPDEKHTCLFHGGNGYLKSAGELSKAEFKMLFDFYGGAIIDFYEKQKALEGQEAAENRERATCCDLCGDPKVVISEGAFNFCGVNGCAKTQSSKPEQEPAEKEAPQSSAGQGAALKDRIQSQWPRKRVEMLCRNPIDELCLEDADGNPSQMIHIAAPSQEGFAGYVYDMSILDTGKLELNLEACLLLLGKKMIFPIAVLFDQEGES